MIHGEGGNNRDPLYNTIAFSQPGYYGCVILSFFILFFVCAMGWMQHACAPHITFLARSWMGVESLKRNVSLF
jgi:hypothetical protein